MAGKAVSVLGIAASIVLGGLSKEVGIFYIPAAIGIYLLIFSQREKKCASTSRLALVVGAAVIVFVIIINWLVQLPNLSQSYFHSINSMATKGMVYIVLLLTEAQIFWRYVSLLVPLSSRLNADHYVEIVRFGTFPQMLTAVIPLLGIVGFLVLAFRQKAKKPIFSFLVLWAILGIIPYLLVHFNVDFMVEYKVYLSTMGFIGLAALCFDRAVAFFTRGWSLRYVPMISIIMFSLLIIFCVKETRDRNQIWKNEITLWEDAVRKSPKKERPYNNLGNAYLAAGKNEESIVLFKKAIEIKPNYATAYYNLGIAYSNIGKKEDSIALFKKTIEINPDNGTAYYSLGNTYNAIGKKEEAIASYKKTIEINPSHAEAYNNLGNIYQEADMKEEAISSYKKAIKINPEDAVTHNNLAVSYYYEKQYALAIHHCDKAIEIGCRVNPEFLKLLEPFRQER